MTIGTERMISGLMYFIIGTEDYAAPIRTESAQVIVSVDPPKAFSMYITGKAGDQEIILACSCNIEMSCILQDRNVTLS